MKIHDTFLNCNATSTQEKAKKKRYLQKKMFRIHGLKNLLGFRYNLISKDDGLQKHIINDRYKSMPMTAILLIM